MNLVYYIGLGAGLAAAAGVRPFAPALLAGILAANNALGVGFKAGGYYFLSEDWWLIAMAACLLVNYLAQARWGSERIESGRWGAAISGVSLGIGALLFAGTLSEHKDAAWPGLLAGIACAAIAQAATRPLLARVRARLPDRMAQDALTLYADLVALVIAGVTALWHPLGYLFVVALAWLALASRRRAGERYAGLRILRN